MPVRASKIENSDLMSKSQEPNSKNHIGIWHLVLGSCKAAVVVLLLATLGGCRDHTYSDHWQQALKAIEDRDFPLAQSHLKLCLDISPLNAEAHFLMGRVCRRADDFAGWQDHLQNAAV